MTANACMRRSRHTVNAFTYGLTCLQPLGTYLQHTRAGTRASVPCMASLGRYTVSSTPNVLSYFSSHTTRQPMLAGNDGLRSCALNRRMASVFSAISSVRRAPRSDIGALGYSGQHRAYRAGHMRAAASKSISSSKVKTVYRCTKCGEERLQFFGQCPGCKSWGSMQEQKITPPPPPSAASGAAAAAALLRSSSSSNSIARPQPRLRNTATSSSSSSTSRPVQQLPKSYDSSYSTDDSSSYLPGSDFPEDLYQQEQQQQQQKQYYRSSSSVYAGGGGWIQPDAADVALPVRLDDISPEESEFRLPLYGATGQEVSRVLGGGLVPGSMVLVGGEPGMGKSTLLLQVAGLVAHTCSSSSSSSGSETPRQQQQHSSSSSSDKDDADDLPLAARLAAAAAAMSSSSSISGNMHWLEEATTAAAAAAAGGGGGSSGVMGMPEGLQSRPVVYFTAEESKYQVWERAKRLGLVARDLDVRLLVENRAEEIGRAMQSLRPAVAVVDSIQTVALGDVSGRPGSVTQVRECATFLLHVAKSLGCATFLVGHVTKDGSIAGPKHLEHLVDVVLYLQGAGGPGGGGGRQGGLRMLRAVKNRHGRVGEVGLFKMHTQGLTAVEDASVFLSDQSAHDAASSGDDDDDSSSSSSRVGTAICVVQEGIRPLPLEIQALASSRIIADQDDDDDDVTSSEGDMLITANNSPDDGTSEDAAEGLDEPEDVDDIYNNDDIDNNNDNNNFDDRAVMVIQSKRRGRSGRSDDLAPLFRHFVGVSDKPRMAMLLELLSKYTPIKTHMYNLFINVVAGYRIPPGETSTDLAILTAIASSVLDQPLPTGTALLAEVGLAGELRPVHNLELRVLELSKLGFSQVVVPARGAREAPLRPEDTGGLQVVEKRNLRSALAHLFGEHRLRLVGRRKAKKDSDNGKSSRREGLGRGSDSKSRASSSSSSEGSHKAAGAVGRRTRRSTQPGNDLL